MATKVALAAALLVALVALSSATTYTTTITTTSFDNEDNRQSQQRCRQVVQQRQFRACQQFLSPRSQYEEVIGMRSVNPSRQHEQMQEECCESLKEMERQGCECEAIRRAAIKVQEQGQQMGQQAEQVYEKAQRLPQTCNLRTQQCRFQVLFL